MSNNIDKNEKNVEFSQNSHHRSSHSSGDRHHHHHHHHRSSKHYKYSSSKDSSSEMERRGENIIYDKVRKERIKLMLQRSIFCLVAIAIIIFAIYSMTGNGGTTGDIDLFNKGISTEEINEMKNKIIKYEYYIEELEERLSEYEEVDGMFLKTDKQES